LFFLSLIPNLSAIGTIFPENCHEPEPFAAGRQLQKILPGPYVDFMEVRSD